MTGSVTKTCLEALQHLISISEKYFSVNVNPGNPLKIVLEIVFSIGNNDY